MAIDIFREGMAGYFKEEAERQKQELLDGLTDISRNLSEGEKLGEQAVLDVVQKIQARERAAENLIRTINKDLNDWACYIPIEGFKLPPAEILDRVTKSPIPEEPPRLPVQRIPVQEIKDKDPERSDYFKDTFFSPLSDEEYEQYRQLIDEVIQSGANEAVIKLGEEQKFSDYREKMVKAGVRMGRKITVPLNVYGRQPTFSVSEPSEYLTFENIENLRNNLGRYSAFQHLPEELLQKTIYDLSLDVRTRNCLLRGECGVVDNILLSTEYELGSFRNFGQAGYSDLIVTLVHIGVVPKVE